MTGGSYRTECRACEASISMSARYCPFCGEVQTHVRDDVDLATVERDVLEELVETAKGKLESDVSLWGPDDTGYDVDAFAATIEAAEDALSDETGPEIRADGGICAGGTEQQCFERGAAIEHWLGPWQISNNRLNYYSLYRYNRAYLINCLYQTRLIYSGIENETESENKFHRSTSRKASHPQEHESIPIGSILPSFRNFPVYTDSQFVQIATPRFLRSASDIPLLKSGFGTINYYTEYGHCQALLPLALLSITFGRSLRPDTQLSVSASENSTRTEGGESDR